MDRDLLAELVENQRKTLRHARVEALASLVLLAVLIITLVAVLPRAVGVIDHMEASLSAVDDAVTNANQMVESANRVLTDNTDAVAEAVGKLNDVDFAALNQAIRDLSNVVSPLARFASMFG